MLEEYLMSRVSGSGNNVLKLLCGRILIDLLRHAGLLS